MLDDGVRINWYIVIQHILPTNERLHKILKVHSPLFRHCGEPDKFQHREPACGEGVSVWLWTKRRIAGILRTETANIPPDWTTRPQFRLLPTGRHRAVLWILAQMVCYRIKGSRACTEENYSDYLRRTLWKAYQVKNRRTNVGNYLDILRPAAHKKNTSWSGSVRVTLFQCLAKVGVEGKPTHAIMVRGPQGHEGKRA